MELEYGETRDTRVIDNNGSELVTIIKIRGSQMARKYKQYHMRVKVMNSKEEMSEYLKHTEALREKRESGILVVIGDKELHPSFTIDYPKIDVDGAYFIIKSWTEYTNE